MVFKTAWKLLASLIASGVVTQSSVKCYICSHKHLVFLKHGNNVLSSFEVHRIVDIYEKGTKSCLFSFASKFDARTFVQVITFDSYWKTKFLLAFYTLKVCLKYHVKIISLASQFYGMSGYQTCEHFPALANVCKFLYQTFHVLQRKFISLWQPSTVVYFYWRNLDKKRFKEGNYGCLHIEISCLVCVQTRFACLKLPVNFPSWAFILQEYDKCLIFLKGLWLLGVCSKMYDW